MGTSRLVCPVWLVSSVQAKEVTPFVQCARPRHSRDMGGSDLAVLVIHACYGT